jgi:hypothetical protein
LGGDVDWDFLCYVAIVAMGDSGGFVWAVFAVMRDYFGAGVARLSKEVVAVSGNFTRRVEYNMHSASFFRQSI